MVKSGKNCEYWEKIYEKRENKILSTPKKNPGYAPGTSEQRRDSADEEARTLIQRKLNG